MGNANVCCQEPILPLDFGHERENKHEHVIATKEQGCHARGDSFYLDRPVAQEHKLRQVHGLKIRKRRGINKFPM